MSFEIKKIGDGPKQEEIAFKEPKKPSWLKKTLKKILPRKKRWYILSPILFFAFYIVLNIVLAVYDYSSDKKFINNLLNPVLSELERDENGFINILLIGQGGEGHDGGKLSDTIMVTSIDTENKNVAMLSVPRDFWVNTKKFGSSRINEIYRNTRNRLLNQFDIDEDIASEEATKIFMKEVEEISGLSIPYYARIDFKGFTEIIDEMDGIEINVEKAIYDESYPDGNWGVELFELDSGFQILDGATALKFARSRHGSSDFDRAARQQKVIQALKDKALSMGILTSPRKIKGLLNVIQENFETNLDIRELITLALLGKDIQRENILSAVLNDDWNSRGGFLGTPPRADYGGAFVLIPYSGENDFSRIHIFTELFFKHRELQFGGFEVLNGTLRSGLANNAAKRLERYGFVILSIGNTPKGDDYDESELWVYDTNSSILQAQDLIEDIFPIKVMDKTGYYEETDVIATFIIGSDFK